MLSDKEAVVDDKDPRQIRNSNPIWQIYNSVAESFRNATDHKLNQNESDQLTADDNYGKYLETKKILGKMSNQWDKGMRGVFYEAGLIIGKLRAPFPMLF